METSVYEVDERVIHRKLISQEFSVMAVGSRPTVFIFDSDSKIFLLRFQLRKLFTNLLASSTEKRCDANFEISSLLFLSRVF